MLVDNFFASCLQVDVLWRIKRLHVLTFRSLAVSEVSASELDNNAPSLVDFFGNLLVA